MKVRVELELELELPDRTENIEKAVHTYLNRAAKVPFGIIFQKLHIVGLKKVEPWEVSLPRF